MTEFESVRKIFKILEKRNQDFSVAESCTGGLISSFLTNMKGASRTFKGAVIAYSYFAKTRLLKIPASVLEKKGAVHPKTAEGMAQGVRSLLKTDWALSITGVMGPEKPPEAEIGQIFVAVIGPSFQSVSQTKIPLNTRVEMKKKASKFCLDFFISKLEE